MTDERWVEIKAMFPEGEELLVGYSSDWWHALARELIEEVGGLRDEVERLQIDLSDQEAANEQQEAEDRQAWEQCSHQTRIANRRVDELACENDHLRCEMTRNRESRR